ncbi:MAG TPA: hypothetical protein VMX97_15000 [Hyphomicrobiaceae bacterium]|nr:hypothetical protein [Hyphomicrobiaceae bacterium]
MALAPIENQSNKRGSRAKAWIAGMAVVSLLGLSGCSGYDVELNGGIFDMMGVSKATQKRKGDPEVAQRTGLVVPPSTASLPAPGTGPQAAATAGASWPVDPEQAKADKTLQAQRQQDAFCQEARRRVKTGIDQVLADGPIGSCHESIVKAFTGKDAYRREAGASKPN